MTSHIWNCACLGHCRLRSFVLLQSKHKQGTALGSCRDHLLADLSEEGRKSGRAPDDHGDILLVPDRVRDGACADSASKVLAPQDLAILGVNPPEIAMQITCE